MVDVGMGEDDIIDFLGVDHDVTVGRVGLKALALEHTAVQQDFLAVVGGDEVLAARYFLGRTDEFDFHSSIQNLTPKVGKNLEIEKLLIEFHTIAVETSIKKCLISSSVGGFEMIYSTSSV